MKVREETLYYFSIPFKCCIIYYTSKSSWLINWFISLLIGFLCCSFHFLCISSCWRKKSSKYPTWSCSSSWSPNHQRTSWQPCYRSSTASYCSSRRSQSSPWKTKVSCCSSSSSPWPNLQSSSSYLCAT